MQEHVATECLSTIQKVMRKASAIDAPEELRDLALTLAVLERKLFEYVRESQS